MGLSRVHAPPRAFVFPVAHALVGVVVSYLALVRTLNVLRITLGPTDLVITQSPIPTRARRLPTAGIDRFDVHDPNPASSFLGLRSTRGVRTVMKDGAPSVDLNLMLDGLDEVAFVAGRLNLALAELRDSARVTRART
jgi:hypothetical protein